MKLKDALEIVLTMAEDNAITLPRVPTAAKPAIVEAHEAQQQAIEVVRCLWEVLPEEP